MRKSKILIFLFISLLSVRLLPAASQKILVQFQKEICNIEINDFAQQYNLTFVQRAKAVSLFLFEIKEDAKCQIMMKELRSDQRIDYVEKSRQYHLLGQPDDTMVGLQWGLHNTGEETGYVEGADISAYSAWDIATGSSDIIVAVIDSGVDRSHVDLVGNLWVNENEIDDNGIDDDENGYIDDRYGWNFRNNTNDPADTQGHGTSVSGIIGAVGNNGTGICGVSWEVTIMPLNCFGDSNSTDDIYLVDAIDYAIDNGAKIINASWGDKEASLSINAAIARANEAGALFVAASGNNGRSLEYASSYPAQLNLPNMISVGSMNGLDRISGFSNYGKKRVHILAPGESCYTTKMGGGYGYKNGTSFSAPHVAGAAAVLYAHYPVADMHMIRGKILGAAVKTDIFKNACGVDGRLNLHSALLKDSSDIEAVIDLSCLCRSDHNALITFTAPGNDTLTEPANIYDIRVSEVEITDGNFFESLPVTPIPTPMDAGAQQIICVSDLLPETCYYVALKSLDRHGNYSPISNIVSFSTKPLICRYDYLFDAGEAGWSSGAPWQWVSGAWQVAEGDTYSVSQEGSITSPVMDFTPLSNPYVVLEHSYYFESSLYQKSDYGLLEISTDSGNSWQIYREFYDWDEGYHIERIPLFGLAGKSQVVMRLRFISDDKDVAPGWFVRRIYVQDDEGLISDCRFFYAEPYGKFNQLNNEPLYSETTSGGNWTLVESYNRTDLTGKVATIARGNLIADGLASKATYTPWFPVRGEYALYTGWGLRGNAYNVSIYINHANGTDTVMVDQDGKVNADQWHYLGTYLFNQGQNRQSGSICFDESTVTGAIHSDYDGMTVFDLVLFELVSEDAGNTAVFQPSWMIYQ